MALQTRAPPPRRSVLYVPAVNARAVDKARSLDCDAVILDLEDAVAADAKDAARQAALDSLKAGGFGGREVLVRCNGLDTPWGAEDLKALARSGAAGVVLPKPMTPDDILVADAQITAAGGDLPIWAMVETCAAVLRLEAIAATARTTRLSAFLLGPNDLAAEMRAPLTTAREALMTALSLMVMAGRAHGLALLDGPFGDIQDPEGLTAQCRQGAMLGFDGKTLIHPTQIEAANLAFSPSAERIAWARRVIAAFAADPGAGVLKVDGKLTERLHLRDAERIEALAQRAQAA